MFPEGNRLLVIAVSRCSILTPAGLTKGQRGEA
jgi:hypothetical protein